MENREEDIEVVKKNLKEILEFGIYKLDNNLLPQEVRSVARLLEGNVEMDASIKELAEFFGKPEVNVRVVINQKLIAKPKRKVLYPFIKFLKVAPRKWFDKEKSHNVNASL